MCGPVGWPVPSAMCHQRRGRAVAAGLGQVCTSLAEPFGDNPRDIFLLQPLHSCGAAFVQELAGPSQGLAGCSGGEGGDAPVLPTAPCCKPPPVSHPACPQAVLGWQWVTGARGKVCSLPVNKCQPFPEHQQHRVPFVPRATTATCHCGVNPAQPRTGTPRQLEHHLGTWGQPACPHQAMPRVTSDCAQAFPEIGEKKKQRTNQPNASSPLALTPPRSAGLRWFAAALCAAQAPGAIGAALPVRVTQTRGGCTGCGQGRPLCW